MNEEHSIVNKITILHVKDSHFKDPSLDLPSKMKGGRFPKFICSCGHSPSTCDFLQRFPDVSYPKVHFFARCQVPLGYIEELSAKFSDPVACLFYISRQISMTHCTIKAYEEVVLSPKGSIKHLNPSKEILDLSFLQTTEGDNTLELRGSLMKRWNSDRDGTKARVLMLSGDKALSPDFFLMSCVGSSQIDLIIPCFSLSSTVVFVNKTKEYFSIALVTKDLDCLPCFAVVFDGEMNPLFPSSETFSANLNNILQHSRFTLASLNSVTEGLTIFLFCSGFEVVNDDFIFQRHPLSLRSFLNACYFEGPGSVSYILQDVAVFHSFPNERCTASARLRSRDLEVHECEPGPSKMLVYYNNALIYHSTVNPMLIGQKRTRSDDTETTKVIVLKSKRFISPHNDLLDWNEELLGLFQALKSGEYLELYSDDLRLFK